MGKTDWKAEAKALKKQLKSLNGAAQAAKPVAKKAKVVSPLAPARFPDLPQIRGVEFAADGEDHGVFEGVRPAADAVERRGRERARREGLIPVGVHRLPADPDEDDQGDRKNEEVERTYALGIGRTACRVRSQDSGESS